jgi:hypothetical protein
MQTRAATTRQPLYFVNAVVDHALIGGVSIIAFALFTLFHSGARTDLVMTTAAALAWIVNWPHFFATSYRLYHARENIRQHPVTALVVPVLIAIAVAGSFASPEAVAPWFVKLLVIWSPYHFSGQSVGISLIYARRAGFPVGRWERLALSGFIFSTFLFQSALAEAGRADTTFFAVAVPVFGVPTWVPTILQIWMGLTGAAFLFFVVRFSLRERRVLPPIVLLPAVTQFVWFVLGARLSSFNEFVPFFHALQYLVVAWLVQLKEKLDRTGAAPSPRYVLSETGRWGAINFVGGIALFFLLPRLGAALGFSLSFSTAVILAAVQIHHFFVDGVIWKLKNPRVSSPLLANLGDLSRPAAKPAVLRAA